MRRVLRLLLAALLLASFAALPGKSAHAQSPTCYTSWPSGVSIGHGTWVGSEVEGTDQGLFKDAFVSLSGLSGHLGSWVLVWRVENWQAGDTFSVQLQGSTSGYVQGPNGTDPTGLTTWSFSGDETFVGSLNPEIYGYKTVPSFSPSVGDVFLVSFSFCEFGASLPTDTPTPTNTPTATPTFTPTFTPTATSTTSATATPLFHVAFTPFIGTAANLFNGLLPFWAIVVGIILAIGLLVLLVKHVREAI